MLTFLRVRNFAIIDELEVELGPGLHVVTGETGAGKSILVDALELVLGGRGKPEVVRTGATQAEVEATFDVSGDEALVARLAALELDLSEGELLIRRVVMANGRTRAYVNGSLATQAQLAEIAAGLADISSQHEHHSLTDPTRHLGYLDAYGKLEAERVKMREVFAALEASSEALREAESAAKGRSDREDVLAFQLKEIEQLAPELGEIAALTSERDRLKHAEKLLAAARSGEDALYARDTAIVDELAQLAKLVGDAAAIDPKLEEACKQIESARAELEEAARSLGVYSRGVSSDPERLNEIDERLHRLSRLAKKHATTASADPIEAILAFRDRAREELAALSSSEQRLELLTAARDRALAVASSRARALSSSRKKVATELGKSITSELASLGMGGAQVRVDMAPAIARAKEEPGLTVDGAALTASGMDRCELLIGANVGEEPRPLRKIASGGELSRTLLAIKRVLAGLREAEGRAAGLYVFDEVDTGVGGAVAEVIGKKLRDVARHHQVLVITHLAPIAVYADRHFQVKKEVDAGRTRSKIDLLASTERLEEVARMLGGLTITKKTRDAAAELLKGARA